MSKIEVNTIDTQCGSNLTVGSAGKTVTVTGNDIRSNNYKASDGGSIISQCGTSITLGASGDTVTLASGATAAGFSSTGEVSWNTTKITADPSNAVSGVGYFADTTSAAFTITLPTSPSAGNVVAISDYAGTFLTNNLTVGRNGSNINGSASDYVLAQNNVTAQFIYVDATQGWRVVFTGSQTGDGLREQFIEATGGTITTCGNCKIHTFTSPGTFCVSSLAENAPNNQVSYMVVAGGGGGGGNRGGGGGAGGFREDKSPTTPYTASPLEGAGAITVTASPYPITVGGGGTGGPGPTGPTSDGGSGSNSVFSTITSAGGAGGRAANVGANGFNGGSGGGASFYPVGYCGGAGNTPPTSPAQGNPGGNSVAPFVGGGGGGATQAGANGNTDAFGVGGPGGDGATTNINGSSTTFSGGGGAGSNYCRGAGNPNAGTGGAGGGGAAGNASPGPGATPTSVLGTAGTANTGGGGGGGAGNTPVVSNNAAGAGGSGIVIIRYKYQ